MSRTQMMEQAKEMLDRIKAPYRECSEHHLKICMSVNYWPATGRIHLAEEPQSRPEKGLSALRTILLENFSYLKR